MSHVNKTLLCLLLAASCSTRRPLGDREAERLYGVRTMVGQLCMTAVGCHKVAIPAAQEECLEEGKIYEFVGTEGIAIKYKCL